MNYDALEYSFGWVSFTDWETCKGWASGRERVFHLTMQTYLFE